MSFISRVTLVSVTTKRLLSHVDGGVSDVIADT